MEKDNVPNASDALPVHELGPLELVPTNKLTGELLRRGEPALILQLRSRNMDDDTSGGVLFWFKGNPAALAQACSKIHSQLWLMAKGCPPNLGDECDVPFY
jgi:hypothetical protein